MSRPVSTPGSHRRLWRYLWRYLRHHKLLLATMILLLLISTAATVLQPFYYKQVIDLVAAGGARTPGAFHTMLALIGMGILLAVIHLTTHEVASRIVGKIETTVMSEAYRDAFAHVQRLSTDFHVNAFAGATSRKVGRGIDSIETIVDRIWFNFLPLSVLTIAFAIVLGLYSPVLGLAMVGSIVLYTVVAIPFSLRQSKLHAWTDAKDSEVTAGVVDAVTANAVVKAFGGEAREDIRHAAGVEEWRLRYEKTWKFSTLSTWFQFMLITAIEGLVLLLAAYQWYRGNFTAGDFLIVSAYVGRLWGYMFDIGNNVRSYLRGASHTEEMIELLDMPWGIQDRADATGLKVSRGEVSLTNVRFRYERTSRPIFEDFTATIRPGEKVAIVGHSGGGKSTLVKLLMRLYDVNGGSITIDGQDIAHVTQESLRNSLSLVPQDPLLFHRTIAENIAYGKPGATMEEIGRAAKLSHAAEFISVLPKQFDTVVGERGIKLSGGERQRIAIARAILADRPILILDEATSSLDSLSEQYIQDALKILMEGRTSIVIAHRLSTIKRADRILVIEHGKIVEEGSHAELTAKESGVYRQLYELQAGGFIGE